MKLGRWRACWISLFLVADVAFMPSLSGQRSYSPPRTPWGDPDLQGIWPTGSLIGVPFERARELGTRDTLTDAEIAQMDAQTRSELAKIAINPPEHWLELAIPSRQASLIIDPSNGRLPAMTPDGERRARMWPNPTSTYFTGPEDFNPYDRCISRGVLGSTSP